MKEHGKKEERYQEVACMDSWIKEFLLSAYPVCNSVLSAAQVVTPLLMSQKPCKRGTVIHHFTGEETEAQAGQVLPICAAGESQSQGPVPH